MRCKNCGWENPDELTNCEKCHAYLSDAAPAHKPTTPVSDRVKGTVAEGMIFCDPTPAAVPKTCPKCGYPVSEDSTTCPNCNHDCRIQRPATGTVMGGPASGPAHANRFCTLKRIAWEGEDVNYNPVTYSGDTIILNRANTDANNNSITSKEQAVLTCENGEWYIENRSELRTTYIRVNGKIKLNSGDTIVLGNREFEFKG